MSFQVNYKLKDDDIRNLELIARTDGYLQVLRMNSDWASLLEREARVREAVSSIGIEGTVLTFDQAKAITVGEKNVDVGEKVKREFIGYYESLQLIKQHVEDKLSLGLLLKIHEKVTVGDAKACPGKIRGDARGIERNGKIVYTAPPAAQLNLLLSDFTVWFNQTAEDKDYSPVMAAAICHFWFVWIHPFCDGNGRVGRLLTTFLLLKKKSEGVRYFALSDYYNKNLDSYYETLQKTNNCDPGVPSMNFDNDLSGWMSYFITSYLVQMKDIKETTNRILQLNIRIDHLRKSGKLTETHNKFFTFLSSKEKTSYKELVDHFAVSKQRIHQILKPLREAHILVEEEIGNTTWFKLGAPEDETDEKVLTVKKKLDKKDVDKNKGYDTKRNPQSVLPIFQ